MTLDGATLFVDGNREGLASTSAVNANAVALWRDRRRQWQHRAKLQARRDFGAMSVRATGTLLDYDFLTDFVTGKFAFLDRRDLQLGLDGGWKQNSASWWFTGPRVGWERQAISPLPNSNFEYSNHYGEWAVGWEGKPFLNTKASITAGPDFRTYSGKIDPHYFTGSRERTSLWFDASITSELNSRATWTGKVTRMNWLASTGKSATTEFVAETALAFAFYRDWSVKALERAHRCTFMPLARDDWESFSSLTLTRKLSSRAQISSELLYHRGWNVLSAIPDRTFNRAVVTVTAGVKF